jgi:Voltage-dependent anion channel
VHPGYYLPTVAGGLVGVITLAQVHLHGLAEASFGIGILSWVLLGSVVLNRLITAKALPAALQPVAAIELAPPALAGVAWFALASRGINLIAYAIGGYLVLMALVQVRLIPLYLKLRFSTSTVVTGRDSDPCHAPWPPLTRAHFGVRRSPWHGCARAWRAVGWLSQELAPGDSNHGTGGDRGDEDGNRCDRSNGVPGGPGRICPGNPFQCAGDRDGIREREGPESGFGAHGVHREFGNPLAGRLGMCRMWVRAGLARARRSGS